jgi:hypothetical protein
VANDGGAYLVKVRRQTERSRSLAFRNLPNTPDCDCCAAPSIDVTLGTFAASR